MADKIIDFYKKAKEPEELPEPVVEQKEPSTGSIPPDLKPEEPFDKFLLNLAENIQKNKPESKPIEEKIQDEPVQQNEPFNKFLLELAEKLQKEKVITKQQQETLAEEVDKPISTNPNEKDPFKKFIGSFANILKQDELVNREENIKEATIDFINKLKEQPDDKPFIIDDELEVKPKNKKKEIEEQPEQEPEKLPEPVVEEQNDKVEVQQTKDNSYVKELKQADKNKKSKKETKESSNIKSIIEKQVAEILSRYPNLGFTGGGGGTNAVQYAEGGTMNGDLNVTGKYLSGGIDISTLFSSGGGTGRDDVNTLVIENSGTWLNDRLLVNTSFSAQRGYAYLVDTTTDSITATLPLTPLTGHTISFQDPFLTWNTNNFILNNNTNMIQGKYEPIACDLNGLAFSITYIGSAIGWRIN